MSIETKDSNWKSLVYVFQNKKNGKIYVGQTVNTFKCRLYQHKKGKYLFQKSLRKNGVENFNIYKFYIPEYFLDLFEKELIKKLNTISPNGYNFESGGNKNKHFCEETRNKMSKGVKYRPYEKREKKTTNNKQKIENKKHNSRVKILKNFTLDINPEQYERMRALAFSLNLNMSSIVDRGIKQWYDANQPESLF